MHFSEKTDELFIQLIGFCYAKSIWESTLIGHNFALPIQDPAELHNIRIAQLDQLLGGFFTATAAAAVDHNELIPVG
jgi:hypothetical protein